MIIIPTVDLLALGSVLLGNYFHPMFSMLLIITMVNSLSSL